MSNLREERSAREASGQERRNDSNEASVEGDSASMEVELAPGLGESATGDEVPTKLHILFKRASKW